MRGEGIQVIAKPVGEGKESEAAITNVIPERIIGRRSIEGELTCITSVAMEMQNELPSRARRRKEELQGPKKTDLAK